MVVYYWQTPPNLIVLKQSPFHFSHKNLSWQVSVGWFSSTWGWLELQFSRNLIGLEPSKTAPEEYVWQLLLAVSWELRRHTSVLYVISPPGFRFFHHNGWASSYHGGWDPRGGIPSVNIPRRIKYKLWVLLRSWFGSLRTSFPLYHTGQTIYRTSPD